MRRRFVLFLIASGFIAGGVIGAAQASTFGWFRVDAPCGATSIAMGNGKVAVLCRGGDTIYIQDAP